MKDYAYMAEKYPLVNDETLESLFPVPDDFECIKVCRYGDGYVYRVLKKWTEWGELPWRCFLYFYSVNEKKLYKTDRFDQIKIHMTDFEHGFPYAMEFEFWQDNEWKRVDCKGEVWQDSDLKQLETEVYAIGVSFEGI